MVPTTHMPTPPAAPADAALIEASLTDPTRFGEVFDRHVDAIFAYVAARIGAVAAEDVVSETFEVAFKSRHRFDLNVDSARPWLYGIATNRLMKHRDAEERWLRHSALGPDLGHDHSGEEQADDRMQARGLASDISRALSALSAAERDVLILHAVEGFTGDEIAAALGIRSGAARTRLSRAKEHLRTSLNAKVADHAG